MSAHMPKSMPPITSPITARMMGSAEGPWGMNRGRYGYIAVPGGGDIGGGDIAGGDIGPPIERGANGDGCPCVEG